MQSLSLTELLTIWNLIQDNCKPATMSMRKDQMIAWIVGHNCKGPDDREYTFEFLDTMTEPMLW